MSSGQKDGLSVRLSRAAFLGFLVVALAVAGLLSRFAYIAPEDGEAENRYFTIVLDVTYENRNSRGSVWNFTEDETSLGLFMNNSWQTVYLTNITYPVERYEADADGNPWAFMSFPRSGIGFGENLSYEIAYRAVLRPRSVPSISEIGSGVVADIPEDLKSFYSGSEGPWQADNSELRGLAYRLAGNDTRILTIVRRLIVWIKENIKYETVDVPRYPNETLLERAGDCDDQANLLIALCRAVGIPAHLQIGCIYIPSKSSETSYWSGSFVSRLTNIGWHGWAVVYVPPWGWLPVDLTYVEGDLLSNPLNAMTRAAVIVYPTVQYANVTTTDYVALSRRQRDFITAHDFRILESDAMDEEVREKEEKGTVTRLCLPPIVLFLLSAASYIACPESCRTHRISELGLFRY